MRDAVLWALAFFPWIDFAVRLGGARIGVPSALTRGWDEMLIVAGLAVAASATRTASASKPLVRPSIRTPLVVCLAAAVLSVLVNGVPVPIAVDALRVTFQPALVGVIVLATLRDPGPRDRFVDHVIASAGLVALLALVQYALGIEGPRWANKPNADQFRVVSVFANPNALGAYLTLALALALALAASTSAGVRRTAYVVSACTLAAGLGVTFSRGAWAGCVVMCGTLVALADRKAVMALFVAAALGTAVAVVPRSAPARVAELGDPAYYQQSARYGRLAFLQTAVASIRDHPVFGVGAGNFGGSVALRHGVLGATWVDNLYAKVAAEMGLPGLAALLSLLFALGWRADRVRRSAARARDRALALGVLGGIVTLAIQSATASVSEALYVGVAFAALVGVVLAVPAPPAATGDAVGAAGP